MVVWDMRLINRNTHKNPFFQDGPVWFPKATKVVQQVGHGGHLIRFLQRFFCCADAFTNPGKILKFHRLNHMLQTGPQIVVAGVQSENRSYPKESQTNFMSR